MRSESRRSADSWSDEKICIIGCGAVGSLFAAHLAKGRGRSLGLRRLERSRRSHPHERSAHFRSRRVHRETECHQRSQRTAALRLWHRRHQSHPHRSAIAQVCPRLRREQRGLLRAKRRRQRRDHRRAREVRHSRHDVSRRTSHRSRPHRLRHQGRHLDWSVRADATRRCPRSKNWPA